MWVQVPSFAPEMKYVFPLSKQYSSDAIKTAQSAAPTLAPEAASTSKFLPTDFNIVEAAKYKLIEITSRLSKSGGVGNNEEDLKRIQMLHNIFRLMSDLESTLTESALKK